MKIDKILHKPQMSCLSNFKNVPLHIEHAALDPKAARGFLPDAQYIQQDQKTVMF